MPESQTKIYQRRMADKLRRIFDETLVKEEWNVAKDSSDLLQNQRMYSPRIDIAVGPFNIDFDVVSNNRNINRIFRRHRKHRLGSIINAASLGKVGVIVAFNDKTYNSLENLLEYINFLKGAKKQKIYCKNIVIIKKDHFEDKINQFLRD